MTNNSQKLLLISFLKGCYLYVPILTLYFLGNGVSLESIVFSQIFYSIFSLLGEVPTGILADKYGQKAAMVIGYLLDSIGILSMFLFPNTAVLFLATGIRGLAGSFMSGAEESLIYETSLVEGKKFTKVYASFISNEVLGGAISSLVAGIAIQIFNQNSYSSLFIVSSLLVLGAGFISNSLEYTKPKEIMLSKSKPSILGIVRESFKAIRLNEKIFYLTVTAILTLNGEYFLQSVYQPLFVERNIPVIFLGLSITIGSILNYLFTKYSYLLEKYLTLSQILLLINSLIGLSYLIISKTTSPYLIVAAFIALQGLFNSQEPVVSDYVNMDIESKNRSTVLSAVSFIRTIFQILARVLLGVSVGIIGVENTLFINGIYILIGISISYYLLVKCKCAIKVVHRSVLNN